jgi:hypothetical protein
MIKKGKLLLYLSSLFFILGFSIQGNAEEEVIESNGISTSHYIIPIIDVEDYWLLYTQVQVGLTSTQGYYGSQSNKQGVYDYGGYLLFAIGLEKLVYPNISVFGKIMGGIVSQRFSINAFDTDGPYYFQTGLPPRLTTAYFNYDLGFGFGGKYYIIPKQLNSFNYFIGLGLDFIVSLKSDVSIRDDVIGENSSYSIFPVKNPLDVLIYFTGGFTYLFQNIEIILETRILFNTTPAPPGHTNLEEVGYTFIWRDNNGADPTFNAIFIDISIGFGYNFI